MTSRLDRQFRSSGLYMSYMNYYATGEGVRSCISVGGSAEYSEKQLKKRIPDYFHPAVVTTAVNEAMNPDSIKMIGWIPDPVKKALSEMPRGAGEFYSEFYYNLS